MFKKSQQEVSDSSKHWYQDKYQHVLTQRNIFALLTIVALLVAAVAVLAVMRLAPLKTVEPYLVQVDDKTGIARRVVSASRKDYTAKESVDRYFTSMYIRMRESYNPNILRYNYNAVRLMSAPGVNGAFKRQIDPTNEESLTKRLGTFGQREVKIRTLVYFTNPPEKRKKSDKVVNDPIIMRAGITTTESVPNAPEKESRWEVTVTFEYADLKLNSEDQLMNPLGYMVTSYQIQPEIQ